MGKGGKSKGKIAFTLIGAVAGFYGVGMHWFGAVGVWQGAMMGASIASTLWSVTQKPNELGNLDSDYSQDDYSRFNTVTNDVNQNACIPVIYGTRKYGGLQTWHNPYNGSRYLQKDVVVCEAGVDGIYNVMANEELIRDDTNISIYNIQHKDATVKRSGNTLILSAGGKVQEYALGSTSDYNAQTSLLSTVIDKIKSEAGNGWKIDGAVDDRTSKGISANSMQFNSSTPVNCYCPADNPSRNNMVVLDVRGYKIGTYKVHQNEVPDNYMDVGGYPNLAWIRTDLVASSRLSGSNPTINSVIRGMRVKVFRNGSWFTEYSENPAWIIRDFLTSERYGTGAYITEDMLDDDSFKEVANYCDEEVEYVDENGNKQKTARYKLNIILDSQKAPIEHLSSMLAVFGGFITFGSQIALKIEKAEVPVYAFDDSTIVKDSVSIGQTSLDDTPNRYKIGYFDPSQLWTEVKVVVEDLEMQEEQEGKITEKTVTLAGCTSQNQALRIGRLYRDLNKVCSLTISFSVATQGMMLECGDVVTVTYGGIFTKMPFRITQIEETNTGIYQLTCRQYNASIYNDSLGAQIVNPGYINNNSSYTKIPPIVSGLKLKENTVTNANGTLQIGFDATWDEIYYEYFDHYEVSYSTDGYKYIVGTNTFDNTAYVTNLVKGKYYVSVQIVTKDGIKGSPCIGEIELSGVDVPPDNVSMLDTDILDDGTRRFWWSYKYPEPNDIVGFKLKYTQGNNPDWNNAYELHTGVITMQPFETKALRQGVHTVMIKAVDNAGNESKNPAYAVLNLGEPLQNNVLWSVDLSANDWSSVSHNGIKENGVIKARTKDDVLEINAQLQPMAYGNFWIEYEIAGSATVQYCVGSNTNAWQTVDSVAWDNPNSQQWKFKGLYKPYTGKVLISSTDTTYIKIIAKSNTDVIPAVSKLKVYIDVPDRQENFENLSIPVTGLTLPIQTPYYYTTAVNVSAVQTNIKGEYELEIMNKTPCKIRFNRLIKGATIKREPVAVVADIIWQGFQREVLT